jgi:hypothetical protein
MRERAAQSLNPEMGRMGAEDPSTAFSAAPLGSRVDHSFEPPHCERKADDEAPDRDQR